MDFLFVPLAAQLGLPVDQIKIVFCLLFSYPLGSVFIRVPSKYPALRHLFFVAIAVFYLIIVLKLYGGSLQLLFSILGTYAIAGTMKGPNMPWVVFVFTLGHLIINHAIRFFYDLSYETFEVTGPQMVLTMKLITFAWNVYDGRRPAAELDKWQMEKRVVKYPSLLAFLGYTLYFPGLLVGPYLTYAAYEQLVDESYFTKPNVKENGHQNGSASGRRIPKGRKRVAYRKMVTGLIWMAIFAVLGAQYHYGVALDESFKSKSLLYRLLAVQVFGIFERSKYYAIWTLTEGASILTGLGFTGYGPNGESKWEGAANVDVLNIELAPNFKVLLDSWNMNTNIWLRECVYKRVTPKGKKPGFRSSMLTFLTSAFWHGIAVGYYLTFAFGGFITTVGRLCRANIRPLLLPASASVDKSLPPPPPTFEKRIYDIAGTICAVSLMNFVAMPFMLLSWNASIEAWRRIGWYGFWMVFPTLAFFQLGGAAFFKGIQAARVKKYTEQAKPITGSAVVTPGPHVVPPVDLMLQEVDQKVKR